MTELRESGYFGVSGGETPSVEHEPVQRALDPESSAALDAFEAGPGRFDAASDASALSPFVVMAQHDEVGRPAVDSTSASEPPVTAAQIDASYALLHDVFGIERTEALSEDAQQLFEFTLPPYGQSVVDQWNSDEFRSWVALQRSIGIDPTAAALDIHYSFVSADMKATMRAQVGFAEQTVTALREVGLEPSPISVVQVIRQARGSETWLENAVRTVQDLRGAGLAVPPTAVFEAPTDLRAWMGSAHHRELVEWYENRGRDVEEWHERLARVAAVSRDPAFVDGLPSAADLEQVFALFPVTVDAPAGLWNLFDAVVLDPSLVENVAGADAAAFSTLRSRLRDLYPLSDDPDREELVALARRPFEVFPVRDAFFAINEEWLPEGPLMPGPDTEASLQALGRLRDLDLAGVRFDDTARFVAETRGPDNLGATVDVEREVLVALHGALQGLWGRTEMSGGALLQLAADPEARAFFLAAENAETYRGVRARVVALSNHEPFTDSGNLDELLGQYPESPERARYLGLLERPVPRPFAMAVTEHAAVVTSDWFVPGVEHMWRRRGRPFDVAALHQAVIDTRGATPELHRTLTGLGLRGDQLRRALQDERLWGSEELFSNLGRTRADLRALVPDMRRWDPPGGHGNVRESLAAQAQLDALAALAMLKPDQQAIRAYARVKRPPYFSAAALRAAMDPRVRSRLNGQALRHVVRWLERFELPVRSSPDTMVALARVEPQHIVMEGLEQRVERATELGFMLGLEELPPAMIVALTTDQLDFDPQAVAPIVEDLLAAGQPLTANDIPLLIELSRRPQLAERLNRDDLVARVRSIYSERTEHRREVRWLDIAARRAGREPQPYTERPDPHTLETLDLLRAVLWDEALGDEAFRRDLADRARADLADSSTEHGGIVVLDPSGRLQVVERTSTALNDGNFGTRLGGYHGGVTGLHFHALFADSSLFSGPSLADLRVADRTGSTEAVVTLLGVDDDETRLNVDLFGVMRNPRAEPWTVDLRTFAVPF